MEQVLVNESSLQDIADAIREKTEGTETYLPSAMGEAIRALKNGVDIANAPTITFDGQWRSWFVEFYNGVPYWEAWFFSSGTLSVNGSYVADAWGIGGGGAAYNGYGGGSGYTNMVSEVTLSDSIPITIGACGYYPQRNSTTAMRKGGTTSLGSFLSCGGGGTATSSPATAAVGGSGGGYWYSSSGSDAIEAGYNGSKGAASSSGGKPMCRFWDTTKESEAGRNMGTRGRYGGGNGWLPPYAGANGAGFGGGNGNITLPGYSNRGNSTADETVGGALVIRILC